MFRKDVLSAGSFHYFHVQSAPFFLFSCLPYPFLFECAGKMIAKDENDEDNYEKDDNGSD